MTTKLLSKLEKKCIQDMMDIPLVETAWISGGSLLRSGSPDIDIVVLTKEPCTWELADAFRTNTYRILERYTQYAPEDTGKDIIIKMVRSDGLNTTRPIDLLVVSEVLIPEGIAKYMDQHYPISIQRIALNTFTWELVNNSDSDSDVVLVRPDIQNDSKHVQKYLGYYPDKKFYQEILKEEPNGNLPF